MAHKAAAPLVTSKAGPASKRTKSSGSAAFALYVLELLMGMFPAVCEESLASDIVATVHAVIFLLMQNVNIYRLNFHAWNFHVFAFSLLLLLRVLVSHWLLRTRRREDTGSQHWWLRLVVPISFILNYILLTERIRSHSFWVSIFLGTHATMCFAPTTWHSDLVLGVQLNARLRSFIVDALNVLLLSSVYPMLMVRDPHLYFDKTRCYLFAVICLLSCAAVAVTRACVAAYLPFSTKGGMLGSWSLKADEKASASGKFSSVKPWSGDKRYLKGDLVLHRGRVHECATHSCSLEPQSPFSMASCALFSQPLATLNGAVGVLAIAVAALLWLAFTSVSWATCWVVVQLHYGIIVWLLRQRPLLMPCHAAGVPS